METQKDIAQLRSIIFHIERRHKRTHIVLSCLYCLAPTTSLLYREKSGHVCLGGGVVKERTRKAHKVLSRGDRIFSRLIDMVITQMYKFVIKLTTLIECNLLHLNYTSLKLIENLMWKITIIRPTYHILAIIFFTVTESSVNEHVTKIWWSYSATNEFINHSAKEFGSVCLKQPFAYVRYRESTSEHQLKEMYINIHYSWKKKTYPNIHRK